MKRADRRQAQTREKVRAVKRMQKLGCTFLTPRRIGRAATTQTPCSCGACGNPRNAAYSKGTARITRQERRADLAAREEP